MDYLEEARELLAMVRDGADPEEVTASVIAQCAIACAGVALVERLDALTVPMKRGEKSLQTYTYVDPN